MVCDVLAWGRWVQWKGVPDPILTISKIVVLSSTETHRIGQKVIGKGKQNRLGMWVKGVGLM